jgi:hypothetical protein
MSLPRAYLSQKLTQALPTKDGAVLSTIGEAASYALALLQEQVEYCNRWRHAAQLLLRGCATRVGRQLQHCRALAKNFWMRR